jgi:NADPH:quinone reductase-like Zn-dependent oxidoreductase
VVGKENFMTTRKSLKKNGTYITSLPRPKVLAHKLYSIFTSGKKVKTFFMKPNADDLAFLKEKVEAGAIIPSVDSVFPLEEMSKAHEYAETAHLKGKVVIEIKKEG